MRLDRLLEHLEAYLGLGPAIAEHMLVQRLAAPDAELEATLEHHGRGGGGLGDHRGVNTHGRAGPAVVTGTREVASANAPSIVHTNEDWPCASIQG